MFSRLNLVALELQAYAISVKERNPADYCGDIANMSERGLKQVAWDEARKAA